MEAWREKLATGDVQAAWELFIERYQRLIVATIRRTVPNADDVPDVLSEVSATLAADDLAILKRHCDSGKAAFSSWLVTVVHHRAIDWIRREQGRRRLTIPSNLSSLQQRIFQRLFVERRTHVEGYELMHQRSDPELSFSDYLKEVAETYRNVELTGAQTMTRYSVPDVVDDVEQRTITHEAARVLTDVMTHLRVDERLAVKLFVIDEMPAASVAKIVGWANAKAVYNRVYRALEGLRKELEKKGIDPSSL